MTASHDLYGHHITASHDLICKSHDCTWCTIPEPGGTMSIFLKAQAPHFRNWNLSLLRWNSISWLCFSASLLLKRNGETEEKERKRVEGRTHTHTHTHIPPKDIHLHRVINNKICRDHRIDFCWVPSKFLHSITHGCKVYHSRHTTVEWSMENGIM